MSAPSPQQSCAGLDFFDVDPIPAQSPVDLDLWDKACSIAESWRGLGLEALRCSVPLSIEGKSILASCPWPALITPLVEASASRALSAAFNIPGLALQLSVLKKGSSQAASWRSRHQALREQRRAQAHMEFQAESLASRFAHAFGAAPELPTFALDEPPLE